MNSKTEEEMRMEEEYQRIEMERRMGLRPSLSRPVGLSKLPE